MRDTANLIPTTEIGYTHLAEYYDILMRDCDYDKWSQYLFGLLNERKILPGAQGADACCGTGSITLRLAKGGYNVTGLDISPQMLAVAAGKALHTRDDGACTGSDNTHKGFACAPVRFVLADILSFDFGGHLDFVTCCCDGINYIPHKKVRAAFASICKNLRPGGVFLFDISSPYKYSQLMADRTYCDEAEGVYCVFSGFEDKKGGRLYTDVDLFEQCIDGRYTRRTEQHIQYIHHVEDIKKALEASGFGGIKCYGFMTKSAIRTDSIRLQFAAVKEGA